MKGGAHHCTSRGNLKSGFVADTIWHYLHACICHCWSLCTTCMGALYEQASSNQWLMHSMTLPGAKCMEKVYCVSFWFALWHKVEYYTIVVQVSSYNEACMNCFDNPMKGMWWSTLKYENSQRTSCDKFTSHSPSPPPPLQHSWFAHTIDRYL